ncbi:uncharacterized protein LOC113779029 isoform X1 [Coffea eugenioides]|uniref:uncharacterized protein LOC113779029 isoform X1 n=1 Tax=Coffea eugenioides TaxID=49369 RepID=UPI000F6103B4|nr:uncharacterized protein LOC113779029 isoform X1 [Coffea eugenioides]
MDLCKGIQVQNAAGHFVTPTGLKKRSGRKTKKVLRSWVDRFHRQKKNSRLSEASTPEMSSESYQPIQSQTSSKCLSSNNSVADGKSDIAVVWIIKILDKFTVSYSVQYLMVAR